METIGGVAAPTRPCPECGNGVPAQEGYVEWCARCDWNVDPGAPDPQPGRLAAVRRRLARRYGEQLAAELQQGAGGASHRRWDTAGVLALAVALLVHGVTAALITAGVLLIVLGWGAGALPLLGVLLLGIAAVLRPRPGRLPEGAPVLYRADAPRLFGLIDEVAALCGTSGVNAVVVSWDANASVTSYGYRRHRVLDLGLGLWEVLGPQERVALLGHELGHFAHGDVRHMKVTSGALHSLAVWHYMLGRTEPRQLTDRFVNALTLLPRTAVYGLLLLLDRLTLRDAQRSEYLADASAARAGSTEAAVGLMDRLLVTGSVHSELRRASAAARMRGGPGGREALDRAEEGLWERLAGHIGAVPEREYERLRRVSALRGHAVDDTHPPTHLRRLCVSAGGPLAAGVVCDEDLEGAVAAELAPARGLLARRVVREFG
ncbi:M48 family metalloprotease [Streptomyces xanthophaeus]